MSARRFLVCAAIVIVAVLCTPAMLVPGFNSADAIVISAPLVLVVVGLWPRRSSSPAGDATSPIVSASPSAASPAGSLEPMPASSAVAVDESVLPARARRRRVVAIVAAGVLGLLVVGEFVVAVVLL